MCSANRESVYVYFLFSFLLLGLHYLVLATFLEFDVGGCRGGFSSWVGSDQPSDFVVSESPVLAGGYCTLVCVAMCGGWLGGTGEVESEFAEID